MSREKSTAQFSQSFTFLAGALVGAGLTLLVCKYSQAHKPPGYDPLDAAVDDDAIDLSIIPEEKAVDEEVVDEFAEAKEIAKRLTERSHARLERSKARLEYSRAILAKVKADIAEMDRLRNEPDEVFPPWDMSSSRSIQEGDLDEDELTEDEFN